MGKTILHIVVIVLVFVVAEEATSRVSTLIPHTPSAKMEHLLEGTSEDGVANVAEQLSAPEAQRIMTAHSNWILLVILPIASLIAAIASRALQVRAPVAFIATAALVLVRIVLMSISTRAFMDVSAIFGVPPTSAGSPAYVALISLILCLSAVVLVVRYRFPDRNRNAR